MLKNICAYLESPKGNFKRKLPVNEKMIGRGHEFKPGNLDEIITDLDKALRFSDWASRVDPDRMRIPFNPPAFVD